MTRQEASIAAPVAEQRTSPGTWARPAGWRTRLDLLGRLLLGGICVANALLHLLDPERTLTEAAAVGMAPAAPLLAVGSAIQGLAGLALVLGWRTRPAALALAALTLLTTLALDRFWSAPGPFGQLLLSALLSKVALAGALVCIAGRGPGRWSLDALRQG